MYVYMRNYVKIKKTIYQKKDNLRTLFVEIPSYKGAVDRAASLESALPNLTLTPSQPTAQTPIKPPGSHLHLIYSHDPPPSLPPCLPQRASVLPNKRRNTLHPR